MNDSKNDLTAFGVASVRVQTWLGNPEAVSVKCHFLLNSRAGHFHISKKKVINMCMHGPIKKKKTA